MGNRALIKPVSGDIGIYLHWHGDQRTVRALLEYCKLRKIRDLGGENADDYSIARFCQIAGNYIGGNLSIGICPADACDREILENGVYIVDKWNISNIIDITGRNRKQNIPYGELVPTMLVIDERQPEPLGKDYITAEYVPASKIKVGDTVYAYSPETDRSIIEYEIKGLADDPLVPNISDGAYDCDGYVRRKPNGDTLKCRVHPVKRKES